jgi:hypothetical protein
VPLIEFLLLLLFVLLVTLLHRRSWANQGMGLWGSLSRLFRRSLSHLPLLRRPEVAIWSLRIAILLRLHVSILRRLHTSILRRLHTAILGLRHTSVFGLLKATILGLLNATILGLRSSLLLISSRLRLRHLSNLAVAAVRLAEWTEAILRRSRPSAWISRAGLRGSDRTNQYLLIQMSTGLRLPLIDGVRRRRRSSDCNHWTADHS